MESLKKQAVCRARELAHMIGFSAQITDYNYELQRLVSALSGEPSVKLILVTKETPPMVLASNRKSLLQKSYKELKEVLNNKFPKFHDNSTIIQFDKLNKELYFSLGFCLPKRKNIEKASNACVSIKLDTSALQKKFLYQSLMHVLVSIFSLIALLVICIWIVDKNILLPLAAVTYTIDKKRLSNRSMCAVVFSDDEIGKLAKSFNQLIHAQEESENLFKNLSDLAPILLWTSDKHCKQFYFNKRWVNFTGQKSAKQNNLDWLKFLDEECAKFYKSEFEKNKKQRPSFALECKLTRKDGKKRWMWTQCVPRFLSNGSFEGYIGCLIDITERKNVEKTLRKYNQELTEARDKAMLSSESKSTFLATMSHEIRTPMNGILGYIYLLKESSLNEEQKNYVNSISASSNLLLELINQILDISKINAGKFTLNEAPYNLNSCIKETIDMFQPMIMKKKINFVLEQKDLMHSFLSGDSKRLKQILINLIGNAVKFTQRGKVTLKLIQKSFNGKFYMRMSIKDSGIGISQDDIDKIFQPFEQGTQASSVQQKGTGLGLSISNSLISLMGGRLHVKSEKNKGSNFFFTIPVEAIEKKHNKISNNVVLPNNNNSNFKIAIAEDNPENQKVMQQWLSKKGFEVYLSDNGQKLIEWLKNNKPNIIFMDIQMPIMDGYETTKLIRSGEAGSENKNLPIVGLTAYALKESCEKCLSSGMNAYLTKPFQPNEILKLINQYS